MAQPSRPELSVIFPMCKQRHGRHFRAFETVAGETLISRAWRSFAPFQKQITKAYFIVQTDDETELNISARLYEVLPECSFEVICLSKPTSGPAETVARGVLQHGVAGPAIVCDADHRLDLTSLFQATEIETNARWHVCVWPLKGESLKRWSVACISEAGTVCEITERQLPKSSGEFMGVIGCYHFPDVARIARQCQSSKLAMFSELFNLAIQSGETVVAVRPAMAEFFGDPERIRDLETGAARLGTVFCDIDGTLIMHEEVPDYKSLPRLLAGSREKLERWIADGYCVVLCTARPSADESRLTDSLRRLGVPFHRLICGLPSGPRVVINDRKPYAMFMSQAVSLEIARNQGIGELELPATSQPAVLRRFPGGSFAETLLLEDEARQFVRKRATKHANLSRGYAQLKRQYRTLTRFSQLCPGLIPELYGESENSHEYYYDLEYLAKFRPLWDCDQALRVSALNALIGQFGSSVYCHRKRTQWLCHDWFLGHLDSKIYAKMDMLCVNEAFRPLLMGEGVEIDGKTYPSLQTLLTDAVSDRMSNYFRPNFVTLVHGDLTFQNILVSPEGTVKTIDLESSDSFEAPELDLGKLFQSIYSQYETWSVMKVPLCHAISSGRLIMNYTPGEPEARMLQCVLGHWSELLECEQELVDLRGRFYLALHLFRMVPFRQKVSEDQALYALATCIQWMTSALERARTVSNRAPAPGVSVTGKTFVPV